MFHGKYFWKEHLQGNYECGILQEEKLNSDIVTVEAFGPVPQGALKLSWPCRAVPNGALGTSPLTSPLRARKGDGSG